MPRFVVLGASGQMGTELVTQLTNRGEEVLAASRGDCDITSATAVRRLLQDAQPQVVFNAAAFSHIDDAESLRKHAVQVNGVGAGIVAAACREVHAANVFFSSAYVFGDGFTSPIDESRTPDPLSVYGQSMLWGEEMVVRNCPRSFIIRCPALYSRYGNNVIRQLTQIALGAKEKITMISDEYISPTPAFLVAQTAIELATEESLYGVYHASTSGACTWHDLVDTFVKKLELDVEVVPLPSARWGAPAPRPAYSALDNMMLRTLSRDNFPDWQTALDAFLETNGEEIIWAMS